MFLFLFFFLSSQLQKAPEPFFLSDHRLQLGPGSPRRLWPCRGAPLWGACGPPSPAAPAPHLLLPSPQQNVMLRVFSVFVLFLCFCFGFFPSY